MTKLEKMQKIHKAGFEPDYYVYDLVIMQDVKKDGWEWKENKAPVLVRKEDCGPTDKPYFSESLCWELLPKTIKREEEYQAYGCETNYTKVKYRLAIHKHCLCYYDGNCLLRPINVRVKNLHEALLDMVLWCIEKGYLTKAGKE